MGFVLEIWNLKRNLYKSFLIKQIINQERIPKGLSRQKGLEEVWGKSRQELHNSVRI